ncbi:MAG: thioesterase family protein [Nocardioidaceae bacterium]|nr:thioesterase family protein [Nocardioidaceae bacterium]
MSAPFSTYRSKVRREWLDYNGHMHDASYGIVLSDANEELFAGLGLSADYREATGASLYTVESHIRYLAECALGEALTASTILVSADARKMHLHTELLHEDGHPVATGEFFYLHVDAALGKVTPMPLDRHKRVLEMLAAHAALPRPSHLGRGLAAQAVGADPRPRRLDGVAGIEPA